MPDLQSSPPGDLPSEAISLDMNLTPGAAANLELDGAQDPRPIDD